MILSFLRQIRENNNREWFQDNRSQYEEAVNEFRDLIAGIIPELRLIDPALGELVPSKCIFRIFRDTRFSKNQDPYKTNFGAFMSKGGRKGPWGGYYLHLEPGASFAGGGVYMPEPRILKAIRDEICYHAEEFEAILSQPEFITRFGSLGQEGQLKRPPKGYDPEFSAIHLLMHRHYVVGCSYTDDQVNSKQFIADVIRCFEVMKPLNDFLNRAISMTI